MQRDDNDQATQLFASTSGWALKAEDPAMAGKTFPVEGSLVVGREDSCDITIPDNLVSREHARVEVVGNALQIEDLGSTNGSFINGRQVTKGNAGNGDEVRFHTTVFRVIGPAGDADKTQLHVAQPDATALVDAMPELAAETDSGAAEGWRATPVTDSGTRIISSIRPCLLGLTPPFQGKKYVLDLAGSTVGRSPSADICLAEGSISSQHARLEEKNGSWRVIDQGSSNGTFINDEQVDSSPVEPGNRVRFGRIELLFEIDDGTDMQARVEEASRSTRSSAGVPAWLYAVGTFLLVAVALSAYLFLGDSPDQAPATQPEHAQQGAPSPANEQRLQISKLWTIRHAGLGTPSTPALADLNGDDYLDVVTVFANGRVQALDGLSGNTLFSSDTGQRLAAPPVTADLTQDGLPEIVLASLDGVLQAINHQGELAWKSKADLSGLANRPVLRDLDGDGTADVLVSSIGKGLVAVNGRTGELLWDSAGLTRGRLFTVPTVADLDADGGKDMVTLSQEGQLLALSRAGGLLNPLWTANTPPVMYASPRHVETADGGVIVTATLKDGVVGVAAKDGSPRWTALPGKGYFASPLALAGDRPAVLVVSLDGELAVLDAATGTVRKRLSVGSKVQATPALYDLDGDGQDEAVLLDVTGRIHVIDLASGKTELLGQIPGADSFVASPLLGDVNNDGQLDVIAAAENGSVFAYSLNRPVDKGKAVIAAFPAR